MRSAPLADNDGGKAGAGMRGHGPGRAVCALASKGATPGRVGVVDKTIEPGNVRLMEASALDALFTLLHEAGYRVIGPTA